MNKRIVKCGNQEFIPQDFAESEKAKRLDTAQKNLLGTLCFYHLNYSIAVAKNDGWFFKDQETLFRESNLSPAEGKRVILKLVLNRLVERIPGTNHKCTMYRLCKDIRELMPQNPETELETMANEPLEQISTDTVTDTGIVTDKLQIKSQDSDKVSSVTCPVENKKRFRDFDNVEEEVPDEMPLSEYLKMVERKKHSYTS